MGRKESIMKGTDRMFKALWKLRGAAAMVIVALAWAGLPDYAIAQGEWTIKTSMPTAREVAAVGVVNGIVYVAGGEAANDCTFLHTLEAYDPTTDTWTTKTDMPARRRSAAGAVANGLFYAMGGNDHCSGALGTVEAYDPTTDTWATKASMPTPRTALAGVELGGIIYAIGGEDSARLVVDTVESYDPATNAWTTRASMPTARHSLTAAVANGKIYAIGGGTVAGMTAAVEEYDPIANTWATKAPMLVERGSFPGAGTVNGLVYVVGGQSYCSQGPDPTFEVYDPLADAWSFGPDPLVTHGSLAGAAAVNGMFYAIGGWLGNSNTYLATVEAFSPVVTVTVTIDIKPGTYPNCVHIDGHGVIPVAVLGSAELDVTQLDVDTLEFAGLVVKIKGNGDPQCSVEDVSGDFSNGPEGEPDGFDDLVCHFVDDPDAWSPGEGEACVTGNLVDGTPIEGCDSICVQE
jgi:N-acetylneuraminic acid mutarotase